MYVRSEREMLGFYVSNIWRNDNIIITLKTCNAMVRLECQAANTDLPPNFHAGQASLAAWLYETATLASYYAYLVATPDQLRSCFCCLGASTSYRQFSNIRRTLSQNINVSRLVLQLFLPNPLKPGVKLSMKM